MSAESQDFITLGRVTGLFGVRGWVRIHSFTDPQDNILTYTPWCLRAADGDQWVVADQGHTHGNGLVAHIKGCEAREQAARWIGSDILVRREQLPELAGSEYYWSDLIGLAVVNRAGVALGTVQYLLETGANDVLVVRDQDAHERLIPYVRDEVVIEVDLEAGLMRVDWPEDF